MKLRVKLSAFAGLTFLATVLVASPASATTSSGMSKLPGATQPQTLPLVPKRSAGISPDSISPSCDYTADLPWEYEGLANADAWVSCNTYVQFLYVTSELQRLRWYGIQTLASNGTTEGDSDYVYTGENWNCLNVGTYTHYNNTSAEVEEGGIYYTGSGDLAARFTC